MMGISVLALLLYSFGVLSVCLSSQAGLTVEAEPGDDVTLWCQHNLTSSGYLVWFKHTCTSTPERIACRYYQSLSSSVQCNFIAESSRTVMTVHPVNSSLTIAAANDSDSGLYYCSIQRINYRRVTFSSTTRLLVKAKELNDSLSSSSSCKEADIFTLTLLIGAVTFILLSAVIILILLSWRVRKLHREDANRKQSNEEVESDLNYTHLQFSNKRINKARRAERLAGVEQHVIYSSVR